MSPLSGVQPPASPSPSRTAGLLSALGDPASPAFPDLIDQLSAPSRTAAKSPALSPAVLQAQQRIADFQRKLALLSGMAQSAQIAMNGQPSPPGGLPSPAAGEYYLARSELARVGLPGMVNEVV